GTLVAGDTGPGNALLDDLMQSRAGVAMDEDGRMAAAGKVDRKALAALLAHPWFDRSFPKSLDRGAFSAAPVDGLATPDAAATLVAFTSATIAKGIVMAGGAERIVVAGGGARNATLMASLAADTRIPLESAAALDWSPDFLEAEAFAFLAVRSLRGLPLTFPGTTGVAQPLPGGVIVRP
ncbi:MAG TPA: anhydro-N-acetylmuramic acid kinase, partial [Bauldia sp.]|nr:anhydro-N-acetylmuramic acid kinase [Bauldia sp.]